MVLVGDREYNETLQILRGKKELAPIYLELKNWLIERFGVTAYNFVFEKIKYNNPENRYQLYILLSSTKDYHKMHEKGYCSYDRKKQDEISRQFNELALKYEFAHESKSKDVWICYNDFSVEIKTDVNSRAYKEIGNSIKEKYGKYSLWELCPAFTSVVVFYQKDSHIKKNSENGISDMIRKDYFEVLLKCDEFNVYKTDEFIMTFDSKENLDKNYSGNLYYYFK